jgi:glycosyltransferase involved in cell wall biosynthesis
MKSGKLLSACMMVRNEENRLGRCLASLKDVVDEIIIVDTGSTDRTIEIAKSFGARVYDHPWQDDFSLHRNQSLSYATSEWCFVIDADEELCLFKDSSWEDLRKFLKRIPKEYPAAALLFQDIQQEIILMQFNSTRFFRNGQASYEGIIHNQPKVGGGQAVFCENVFLKHYGYDMTEEQKKVKFERTHSLLLRQIEKGQTKDGLPFFYLCQIFAQNDFPEEAIVWGEKYMEMYEKGEIKDEVFTKTHYFTMVKQYLRLENKEKAFEWLVKGHAKVPNNLDLTAAALEYAIWIDNNEMKIDAAKDFLHIYQEYEKDPSLKALNFVFALRPEVLAVVELELAVALFKESGKAFKHLFETIKTLPPKFKEGILTDLKTHMTDPSSAIKFGFETVQPPDVPDDLTTMTVQ